ncbi:MAG: PPOX class F420-dependent oxidoreductase [Mycobacterium sp.]
MSRLTIAVRGYTHRVDDDLARQIGTEKFVSLTTFKRDGSPVAGPMWIAHDGDHLEVWTPADSWKVKRLRRDPRVRLTACSRTGKVAPGAPVLEATAVVIADPPEVARVAGRIKDKYGFEFRVITFVEAVLARGRKTRVALQIS